MTPVSFLDMGKLEESQPMFPLQQEEGLADFLWILLILTDLFGF